MVKIRFCNFKLVHARSPCEFAENVSFLGFLMFFKHFVAEILPPDMKRSLLFNGRKNRLGLNDHRRLTGIRNEFF